MSCAQYLVAASEAALSLIRGRVPASPSALAQDGGCDPEYGAKDGKPPATQGDSTWFPTHLVAVEAVLEVDVWEEVVMIVDFVTDTEIEDLVVTVEKVEGVELVVLD